MVARCPHSRPETHPRKLVGGSRVLATFNRKGAEPHERGDHPNLRPDESRSGAGGTRKKRLSDAGYQRASSAGSVGLEMLHAHRIQRTPWGGSAICNGCFIKTRLKPFYVLVITVGAILLSAPKERIRQPMALDCRRPEQARVEARERSRIPERQRVILAWSQQY